MRPFVAILLLFAVAAVAGTESINISLPDGGAPETVLGTVESVRDSVEQLVQVGDDLMSLANDVLRWFEAGVGYLERLMAVMESGMRLVNETVEQSATSP